MINEKGFMVINMIAAVVISSIIAIGAGMTTAQIITRSKCNEEHTTVIRQAQNIGFSVSEDMVMARMVANTDNAATPDVEFITIVWKDWETGYKHDIRYIWSNPADSQKKVIRTYTIYDESGLEISSKNTLLADNIYSANLTQQNDAWRLTVEARSGEKNAVREYEINQRVH
jgi:type II secretory pathway component PulJ